MPTPSDRWLASILDTSNEGIWFVDADARTLYLNRPMAEVLGASVEELLGRSLLDFIDPVDDVAALEKTEQRRRGFSGRGEFRLRRQDGSTTPIAYTSNPVFDELGNYVGALAIITDLTERRAAEAALSDAQQRLTIALEAYRFGIWDWDVRADKVVWSESLKQFLEGAHGRAPRSYGEAFARVHPDDWGRIARAMQDALTAGTDYKAVFRYIRSDGGVIWHESVAKVIRDDSGRAVRMLGVSRDVTEQTENALAESRLAAIVESSEDAIVSNTLDGTILTWNRAAERIYGYSAEEAIGANVEMLVRDACPDDTRQLRARIMGGERVEQFETVRVRKDGRKVEVSLTLSPVKDASGNLVGIAAIARDITERKRVEEERDRQMRILAASQEQLRALSRRLVEVQESERRHIARELHDEIGQTLTFLKLTLEIGLQREAERGRRMSEACEVVVDLIGRVRQLSLDLRSVTLDDLGLLPSLLELFERYTAKTGVRVAFEHSGLEGRLGPELETAAYRVVQEALTNVARHARVGRVAVGVRIDGGALVATIEDLGRGFDPGTCTAAGATGGLSGMRERAELLGGRLVIASARGAGTRVRFEVPIPGATDLREETRGEDDDRARR